VEPGPTLAQTEVLAILIPAQDQLELARLGRRIPFANLIGIDDPGEVEIGTAVPGEPGPCCLGLIDQIGGNGLFDSGQGLILRDTIASEIGTVRSRIQSDLVAELSFSGRRLTSRSRSS